jgi:hypothetical protein
MNYVVIALVFIIALMLYIGYTYLTNTTLTSGVVSLRNPSSAITQIEWTKINNPGTNTYHYEGWLFVKNLPDTKTAILRRGNTNFALCLNGSTLSIDKQGSAMTNGTTSNPTELVNITTKFPVQKWVYFVVNVINNNIVETYLNGKLVNTIQLQTPLTLNVRDALYVGGTASVDGFITKFKRDPKALLPDDVWKTYVKGNGLATMANWLAGYNASFSVYNTTEEVKKYTLF